MHDVPARMQEWSRALGPNGWTMTFELRTSGSSIDAACRLDDCMVERGEIGFSSRRSRVRTAESEGPRIVVRRPAPGRWACQVRAIRVTGGEWSDEVTVRIPRSRS